MPQLLGSLMAVVLQLVCLLCSQILFGHPPPYAVDVTAQAPTGPTPAAILSPPMPEGLPPAVSECLPQLPSSQAPAPMAVTPSLPVQSTVLPPTNLPLTSGPGLSSLNSAVQLTVELAPEVCGLGLPHGTLMPGPAPVSALDVGRWDVHIGTHDACSQSSAVPRCQFPQMHSRWKVWGFFTSPLGGVLPCRDGQSGLVWLGRGGSWLLGISLAPTR